MINMVLTQYFGCWENIAQFAHKDVSCFWLRSWRISQAGRGACVCVCGGLHRSRFGMRHPFKYTALLWVERAHPCPCGVLWADWAGRARAVYCGLSVNYNDIEYYCGRLTPQKSSP